MELRKSKILVEESMVDFICSRAKRHNIDLSSEQLRRVLKNHFSEMVLQLFDEGSYKRKRIMFRIFRKETVLIPSNERQYFIMPNFSSVYSYSLRASFFELYRGMYYLRPCKEILNIISEKVNSSPDLKIKFYGKKTS